MDVPSLVETAALVVVAAASLFLACLGLAALIAPARAEAFLLGFAATRRRHALELTVRLAVGLSLMLVSPRLPAAAVFLIAGTVLVATTAIMALLPYRAHAAFARRAVPRAVRHLPLLGAVSLAMGLGAAWALYVASVA